MVRKSLLRTLRFEIILLLRNGLIQVMKEQYVMGRTMLVVLERMGQVACWFI